MHITNTAAVAIANGRAGWLESMAWRVTEASKSPSCDQIASDNLWEAPCRTGYHAVWDTILLRRGTAARSIDGMGHGKPEAQTVSTSRRSGVYVASRALDNVRWNAPLHVVPCRRTQT